MADPCDCRISNLCNCLVDGSPSGSDVSVPLTADRSDGCVPGVLFDGTVRDWIFGCVERPVCVGGVELTGSDDFPDFFLWESPQGEVFGPFRGRPHPRDPYGVRALSEAADAAFGEAFVTHLSSDPPRLQFVQMCGGLPDPPDCIEITASGWVCQHGDVRTTVDGVQVCVRGSWVDVGSDGGGGGPDPTEPVFAPATRADGSVVCPQGWADGRVQVDPKQCLVGGDFGAFPDGGGSWWTGGWTAVPATGEVDGSVWLENRCGSVISVNVDYSWVWSGAGSVRFDFYIVDGPQPWTPANIGGPGTSGNVLTLSGSGSQTVALSLAPGERLQLFEVDTAGEAGTVELSIDAVTGSNGSTIERPASGAALAALIGGEVGCPGAVWVPASDPDNPCSVEFPPECVDAGDFLNEVVFSNVRLADSP